MSALEDELGHYFAVVWIIHKLLDLDVCKLEPLLETQVLVKVIFNLGHFKRMVPISLDLVVWLVLCLGLPFFFVAFNLSI